MIIVKLMGGLGNQMFQYAAARRISHVSNALLKLDTSWFGEASPDTKRKYELNVFNLQENFATLEEVNTMREFAKNGKPILRHRILNKILPRITHTHILENHFNFNPDILRLKDNVYLDGYWQSEKYFYDIREILIEEFMLKTAMDPLNKNISDQIQSSESISVHVRRGDYVSNHITNQYHGTCEPEYYHTAANILVRKIKGPRFFVFSDEPDWVRENLKLDYPVTYMDFNGTEKGHEDLRLMSFCKHHIVANSSFSWWGAWLSQNHNKIVVAPSKWFNDASINTKDLLPDDWLRI